MTMFPFFYLEDQSGRKRNANIYHEEGSFQKGQRFIEVKNSNFQEYPQNRPRNTCKKRRINFECLWENIFPARDKAEAEADNLRARL